MRGANEAIRVTKKRPGLSDDDFTDLVVVVLCVGFEVFLIEDGLLNVCELAEQGHVGGVPSCFRTTHTRLFLFFLF